MMARPQSSVPTPRMMATSCSSSGREWLWSLKVRQRSPLKEGVQLQDGEKEGGDGGACVSTFLKRARTDMLRGRLGSFTQTHPGLECVCVCVCPLTCKRVSPCLGGICTVRHCHRSVCSHSRRVCRGAWPLLPQCGLPGKRTKKRFVSKCSHRNMTGPICLSVFLPSPGARVELSRVALDLSGAAVDAAQRCSTARSHRRAERGRDQGD